MITSMAHLSFSLSPSVEVSSSLAPLSLSPLSPLSSSSSSSSFSFLPSSFHLASLRGSLHRWWPPGQMAAHLRLVRCSVTQLAIPDTADSKFEKEPHKYFDQVVITVRSGDGGHGAVLSMPNLPAGEKTVGKANKGKEKKTRSFRRGSDGALILPMGGHGGDVIIYADEGKDDVLELHRRKRYSAKRGSNADSMGRLNPYMQDGASAPTLRIPVPVGTVVKRKRGGKFLADLAHPGDEVLVAKGGRGGISLVELPKHKKVNVKQLNAPVMKDPDEKAYIYGLPGEELTLELTLRVVADVGLVGLPNAGKSSLLAAVTRARPEIADYPFTTLMPNLGRLDGDPGREDGGFAFGPTVADLPGLIKGAHLGKGLGKMFLRHLRRTRLVVHVVDAAAEDPVRDYNILREELLMYNPEYLRRPHIVVLNKLDIPEARQRFESLEEHINRAGVKPLNSSPEEEDDGKEEVGMSAYPSPVAVVGISAKNGEGVDDLLQTIRSALQTYKDKKVEDKNQTIAPSKRELHVPAQWSL